MKNKNELIIKNEKKIKNMTNNEVNLFPNDFYVKNSISEITSRTKKISLLQEKETTEFIIAGRIMSINKFGKSAFMRIKDRTGLFQIYIKKDIIEEKEYELCNRLKVGDFIGTQGYIFKTKTGEWTLLSKTIKILCKSIRSLPEKFHGLKDPEKRYRQRYIDLIMNKNVKDIFIKRSKTIQAIRSFFLNKEYIEVETPMMHSIPGGADAAPFETYHNALNINLYLRVAPELYLKRLIIGGFERVFEINKNFRNEGISSQHNPEFTMLEFYQAYSTYKDLMKITKKMFLKIAKDITGSTTINYQNKNIYFDNEWETIPMLKALEKFGGIEPSILRNKNKLIELAIKKGVKIKRKGKIIEKLFDLLVEPKLIQPTFITEYPIEISPLSRKNDYDSNIVDRFELFIAGMEIANGFSELTDPNEQKTRFIQQNKNKDNNSNPNSIDMDYIKAMEYGMPPTAGQGIGIDRLVMLLTDASSIREVILFPHMKPVKKNKKP